MVPHGQVVPHQLRQRPLLVLQLARDPQRARRHQLPDRPPGSARMAGCWLLPNPPPRWQRTNRSRFRKLSTVKNRCVMSAATHTTWRLLNSSMRRPHVRHDASGQATDAATHSHLQLLEAERPKEVTCLDPIGLLLTLREPVLPAGRMVLQLLLREDPFLPAVFCHGTARNRQGANGPGLKTPSSKTLSGSLCISTYKCTRKVT